MKNSGGKFARSSTAFLLAQVGAQAARRFGELLAPLRLQPPHAGILGVLGRSEGLSQQALAGVLHMYPSALVALIDDLEKRGLVKRQDSVDDRRTYQLQLTDKGRSTLGEIGRLAREHDELMGAALTSVEREQLNGLLQRIADQQALTPGVHPGFRGIRARRKS